MFITQYFEKEKYTPTFQISIKKVLTTNEDYVILESRTNYYEGHQMDITINEGSSVPVYEQIVIQVLIGIRERRIEINAPLPTIRQLALDLELTSATVAKAYQILERGKVITTGGRRGTYIHEQALENSARFIQEQVETQMREFIHLQLKYGISLPEIQTTFTHIINELTKRGAK
jgi:GntR family transcriptional regulator